MSEASTSSRKPRSLTASQIAKDPSRFAVWSAHQNLVEASYGDLPRSLLAEVDAVFDLQGQLPSAWIQSTSKEYKALTRCMCPKFLDFLRSAEKASPSLFSREVEHIRSISMLRDLQHIYSAWVRLRKMRTSSHPWSEADYASQVYNVLRATTGQRSEERSQCMVALPQPFEQYKASSKSAPSLKPRMARPDGALLTPPRLLKHLSESANSPLKQLERHPRANNSASHGGESSFKWQSTICTRLPDPSQFEIASTFWEDKKPSQKELSVAYRQNRMSTAAGLRQLHTLNIRAPIFGLVWAEGTVRAHVDWWEEDDEGLPSIFSAPYPGLSSKRTRRQSSSFHEWSLERPDHIIQVYLLLLSLDRWTVKGFKVLIEEGIQQLAKDVKEGNRRVVPWRGRSRGGEADATVVGESISSSPVKPKVKRYCTRASTKLT